MSHGRALLVFAVAFSLVAAMTADLVGSGFATIEEDSVEFGQPSYSPGSNASVFIRDSDLNTVYHCNAGWSDLSVSDELPIPEETLWNLATGSPEPTAYDGLNEGCGYDFNTPSNTPIAWNPPMTVTVNGFLAGLDDLRPETGEFSIQSRIDDDGSDLEATFHYEIVDVYSIDDGRVRITSTSDVVGEMVGISEINDESDHSPNPASGLFVGGIGLGTGAPVPGDGTVTANLGDLLTVQYLGVDGVTVISSSESLVEEPAPTPTPLPSANVVVLFALAVGMFVLSLWRLNRNDVTAR